MLNSNSKKVRIACETILAVATVVLGIVFICIVADVYYSGKNSDVIYSAEIVKERLLPLIAPLVVWLLGVIACFVLSIYFPDYQKKEANTTKRDKINVLKGKLPSSGNQDFEKEKRFVSAFEKIRLVLYGVASAFSLVSAVFTIVYIANVDRFSNDINASILGLVKNCAPFIAVSFLLFFVAVVYEKVTANLELKSMTKTLVLGKGNKHIDNLVEKSVKRLKSISKKYDATLVWSLRGVTFALALVFLILGILNGGVQDVWSKAINICTECIGLG